MIRVSLFQNVNAGQTVNLDTAIPSNQAINIHGIFASAPGIATSGVRLIFNPAGSNTIVFASYADQNVYFGNQGIDVPNSAVSVRIQLVNNDSQARFLGMTILYTLRG